MSESTRTRPARRRLRVLAVGASVILVGTGASACGGSAEAPAASAPASGRVPTQPVAIVEAPQGAGDVVRDVVAAGLHLHAVPEGVLTDGGGILPDLPVTVARTYSTLNVDFRDQQETAAALIKAASYGFVFEFSTDTDAAEALDAIRAEVGTWPAPPHPAEVPALAIYAKGSTIAGTTTDPLADDPADSVLTSVMTKVIAWPAG